MTFSDGRVLCYLIHHYHPGLISEESVHRSTTQTVDCSSRGRLELNCSAIDSDSSFDDAPESPNGVCHFTQDIKEMTHVEVLHSVVSDWFISVLMYVHQLYCIFVCA